MTTRYPENKRNKLKAKLNEMCAEMQDIIYEYAGPAIGLALFLTFVGGSITAAYKLRMENMEYRRIFEQVAQVAAEKDQIIDREEKSMLLKKLNIPGAIDETERIEFARSGNKVIVYASAGYRYKHQIGMTDTNALLQYIKKHTQEEEK